MLSLAPALGADMKGLNKALKSEIRASGAKVSLAFKDLETGRKIGRAHV